MQKTKNSGRGVRRGRRRNRASLTSQGNSLGPPEFTPTILSNHKFRFSNAISTVATITRKNLLDLVVVAITATTSGRIIEGIRLKKVEVWTQPAVLGSANLTSSIEWIGENSPSIVHSDTTMGIRPAHVLTRPPPSSSNRWWSMSGFQEIDDLFTITAGAESITDVSVAIRFVEMESPTAGPIPVGATPGQMYGVPLDGIAGNLGMTGFIQLP